MKCIKFPNRQNIDTYYCIDSIASKLKLRKHSENSRRRLVCTSNVEHELVGNYQTVYARVVISNP